MSDTAPKRIPLWLKTAFTAFMLVLVPTYLKHYGPTNFLYLCDLALLFTLVGIWTENRLLIGIPAVGIVLPQLLWCLDFLCGVFGWFPLGFTGYMFDDKLPFFLRSLSLFHGWLPLLLLYLVARVGYAPRSVWIWWLVSGTALAIAYAFLPAVKDPANPGLPYNVNYVFGADKPQEWMSAGAWFALMMVVIPVGFSLPTHFVFRWWKGPSRAAAGSMAGSASVG